MFRLNVGVGQIQTFLLQWTKIDLRPEITEALSFGMIDIVILRIGHTMLVNQAAITMNITATPETMISTTDILVIPGNVRDTLTITKIEIRRMDWKPEIGKIEISVIIVPVETTEI